MSKMLVLENVRKTFGSLVAVDDVNLQIEPGEFICFLGPSGCGKTTLLRLITGFERLSSGNIFYDGRKINELALAAGVDALIIRLEPSPVKNNKMPIMVKAIT